MSALSSNGVGRRVRAQAYVEEALGWLSEAPQEAPTASGVGDLTVAQAVGKDCDQLVLLSSTALPPSARGPAEVALFAGKARLGALARPPGGCRRRVQGHGGANERLQCLFIDLVAGMNIDGTPGVAFEAGIEEA